MINIISLFSGYDSPLIALKRLNINYNLLAWSDIDKAAIHAHNNFFPEYEDRNLGDIQNTSQFVFSETVHLLFYSSPCQDLSVSGRLKGADKDSQTRSSLLWEVEKFIRYNKPTLLIFENVPTLTTIFKDTLKSWIITLSNYGYNSVPLVLNTKDFGIPQNRKRLFLISSTNALEHYELKLHRKKLNPITKYLDKEVNSNLWIPPSKINLRIDTSLTPPIILGHTKNYHNPALSNYHNKKVVSTITQKNCLPYCALIYHDGQHIRRLSHIERARLQGLTDTEIETLFQDLSETAVNKLVGNAITITVLEELFKITYL